MEFLQIDVLVYEIKNNGSGGNKMAETENSKDLISVLWSGADILRSKMDANEYKDYLLGIVFYKYLSDSFLIKVYDMICDDKPESLKEALEAYKEELKGEYAEDLVKEMRDECHYVIEPELTYTYFADAARNNAFNREQLQKAFNNIEQSDPIFADLFTDIDLYSNRLGTGDQKQSDTVANLIKEIDKADLLNSDAEILGNAYEYLIGQFASETGKKAGEFYTPQAVSKILTRIAIAGQEEKRGLSVYDPCMGSGSLLLNAKKYSEQPQYIKYYGQELNTSTYNLARMNMFLHGIVAENQKLRNGDTLDGDWPTDEETDFNMVLMNPPYSAKWSAAAGFLQDERFSEYGVLAPKSKADYAFLLHGLYHLKNNGTMAIVLPHGVLFRGAAEGKIREKLLRAGNIYAVIGLPANLFYNTSIPTCIIVLKKHRDGRDVLFIDASKKFNKGKKQNEMLDEHIDEVMNLYTKRETVEKEAFLASFEDIEKNDFNLNIPRYVDTFEEEEPIDLNMLLTDMKKTDEEIEKVEGEFLSLMKQLTSTDETIMTSLNDLIGMMEGK
jgi:type I restriction enzyme M protein